MTGWRGRSVLVTGATGFLGSALTRRLVTEGAAVRALARRKEKAHHLQDLTGVEILIGDITDPAAMRKAAMGCEIVFHVAAALGGPLYTQQRTNVHGTRTVVEAAADGGARRVVHVSSIAVYGYRAQQVVTEDMPLAPGSVPYNITKAEAERAVREVGSERQLEYSIIRPGLIYGPGSHMWTAVAYRLARMRPTPFIGNGSGSAYPIYVDDVVDMMLILATHPQAAGEAFNCTPDPSPTWRAYIGAYQRLAGHGGWIGLPTGLARAVAPMIDLGLRLRAQPQDVADALTLLLGQHTYSITKARTRLGWTPQVPLHDGVARCAGWLQEIGLLRAESGHE